MKLHWILNKVTELWKRGGLHFQTDMVMTKYAMAVKILAITEYKY